MKIVPGIVSIGAAIICLLGPGAVLAQVSGTSGLTTGPLPLSTQGFPKWSEFPLPPTQVPTVAEIKVKVEQQNALRDQLIADVAAIVWDNADPDLYAVDVKSRLDSKHVQPMDPTLSPAALEAFASDMRKKATPPPVAN